jgi:hypothetical protein
VDAAWLFRALREGDAPGGSPDVARLEHWLPDEMSAVRDLCRALAVPLASWPDHPALSSFVDLAVRRCVDDLIVSLRARSETHALQLAAPRFGLNPDSVRRRWQRYRKAAQEMRHFVPHEPRRAA